MWWSEAMKAQGTRKKAQGTLLGNSFCLLPFAFCLAASILLLAGCGFQREQRFVAEDGVEGFQLAGEVLLQLLR